ncbi:MAG: hypothetical protein JXA97_10465 [Anaerolineales bacterium]|nr:hypothetical protein [Anaerolineales bacterium]
MPLDGLSLSGRASRHGREETNQGPFQVSEKGEGKVEQSLVQNNEACGDAGAIGARRSGPSDTRLSEEGQW